MIEVVGAEEAQDAILALYDEGEIEDIAIAVLHRLQSVAMDLTPVDTGAMRSSWVVTDLMLHIAPTVVNPRTGQLVTAYAGIVADRVGIQGALVERFGPFTDQEATRYGY